MVLCFLVVFFNCFASLDRGLFQVSSETKGVTGLPGRYANALFNLAEEESAVDQVADDLDRLLQAMEESEDLDRLIRSPVTPRGDQARAMDALLDKMGMADLTRRFIAVVAGNRRLVNLRAIVAAFGTLLAEQRGEATAEVISAKALSDNQMAALCASLKAAIGSTVTVVSKVDSGLLGGLVVRVGSRMIDSSLRTKIQQLHLAMKGVG